MVVATKAEAEQVRQAVSPGISVVLCCHNARTRLEPTLTHLLAQSGMTDERWEVIVVDNASTDGTGEFAKAVWQAGGAVTELRVLREEKLGVVNARITGIMAARHEILSFVDDDNWVAPTWCRTILDLMAARPGIGVIGGRSTAVPEPGASLPPWFAGLAHGYAVGPQAARTGWVEKALPQFYGAGLTARSEALKALVRRGFSTMLTGRFGRRLTAGEDSELCYALGLGGLRFWYEDSLRFAHFMPRQRLTEDYARRLFRGLGVASGFEDLYHRQAAGRVTGIKHLAPFRYANAVRLLLRHGIRSLSPMRDAGARSQARIEISFFLGRLEGIRASERQRRQFIDHIARWASPQNWK